MTERIIRRGADVLALLTLDMADGEVCLTCPGCGGGHTHVHHVGTLVGSDPDEAVVAYPGTAATGVTGERRSAVEIVFSCEECSDQFALVVQQHKGVNYVEVHLDVGTPPEPGGGPAETGGDDV